MVYTGKSREQIKIEEANKRWLEGKPERKKAKDHPWKGGVDTIKSKFNKLLKDCEQPEWAITQTIRHDRHNMVEDICKHGCGHPNMYWMAKNHKKDPGIHGCCGCCQSEEKDQYFKEIGLRDED